MSKHHDLKIESHYFHEVKEENKLFEIRLNDRDFQKGDTVTLKEYGKTRYSEYISGYTGEELDFVITYVTAFNQKESWVVFGIKPLHTESK